MIINHDNYPDSYLKQILTEVKTIALVGASQRSHRDSYLCMEALLKEGYAVIPVNPREAGNQILGQYCYESLAAIGQPVDMVDIFRAEEFIFDITKEAIKIGADILWTQEGIIDENAASIARSSGMRVIMNECPKKVLEA